MLSYNDDDFETIDLLNPPRRLVDFVLADFEEDDLRQIRLFHPEKAQDLEKRILPKFRAMYPYLFTVTIPESTNDFRKIKRLKQTVNSIPETKKWLSALGIPADKEFIVSFDLKTALLMQWSFFYGSYEKFCYNGINDICIISICERWLLLYYHEDIFIFGMHNSS